ncbi:MAG TPA: choice-of-anchor L domain-containing protein [Terriglobia bacterium]|nr:choice-of-anchor L domain-containing protein [Terriglobia bacterium]
MTSARIARILVAVVFVLLTSQLSFAATTVGPIVADPPQIQVNIATTVKITAAITDSTYIAGSANLQRRNANNTWTVLGTMRDDGTAGDAVAGDKIFTFQTTFQEFTTQEIHLRASAAFRGQLLRVFSPVFDLPVGFLLAPNAGGLIQGTGGTTIEVPPNALPFEALIGIELVDPATIVPPSSNLPAVAGFHVIYEPTGFNNSVLPANLPLKITVPTTAAGTQFVVAQEVLSDSIAGIPSLRNQLVFTDVATRQGSVIVSEGSAGPGVLGGGPFIILADIDSGLATGIVSDATGPRRGAVVSNTTNSLVAVTNSLGRYTLFINGGLFTVTGFDPFKGSLGSSSGNVVIAGSTVTANLSLTPVTSPPITRDGIRNSGFERGDLTSWATSGAASAVRQLGPTSTEVVIRPTEGQWMADINTGTGAVGGVGSSLKQTFKVPAGVRTLRVDFNFVSEEFPEFVGSEFDDSFRALITTPNGQTTFASVSVNASGGFQLIGDCLFPGGDNTCGQTGWRTGTVDLSAYAGTTTPITVELLFSADDRGDNIYDTHVLIDNIRFATLWIDAKIISGAAADVARVQNEVRGANEILSQAGLNVRLRNVQTTADPGGLLDTDITWTTGASCADGRVNGRLTFEERRLLGLSRSETSTDLNVYYVRSGTGLAGVGGLAIGPDDFCVDVDILTNSGTLQMDLGVGGNILAHEIGHMTISPQTAGNTLEHAAPAGNFLSTTPALGILNRDQSADINRVTAPLLVP